MNKSRYIKIKIKHTNDYLMEVSSNMSDVYMVSLKRVFQTNPHVNLSDENGKIIIYMVIDEYSEGIITDIFDNNSIDYIITDMTTDLIDNKDSVLSEIDKLNIFDEEFYKKDEFLNFATHFRIDAITIDMLLDKISKSGMKSLTDEEITILNEKSACIKNDK